MGWLQDAGSYIGENNPFKDQTPAKYDPTTPKDVTGPQLAADAKSPTVDANGIKTAQIGAVADPRMTMINSAPQDQFRQNQADLAKNLAAQANGTGPSVAVNTLRQGQEGNLAGTMAVLNSQRGQPNPALARAAMETNAEQQGKLAMDASTARLQEQMQAAGMLNNVASAGRQQDIGLATSQAQMDQQANLAKYQGDLQKALAQGQIDQNTYNQQMDNARANATMAAQFQQLQAQYAGMGMTAAQANQAAALQVQQINANQVAQQNKYAYADQGRRNGILGQVFSGASGQLGSMLSPAAPATTASSVGSLADSGGAGMMAGGDAAAAGGAGGLASLAPMVALA